MSDVDFERRVSRTGLLKLGAVAAFVAGTGGAAKAFAGDKASAAKGALDLRARVGGPSYLKLATYAPLVGSSFRIRREGENAFSAKLISAKRIDGEGEAFSLIFRGGGATEQSTYTLSHPSVGSFPLFLVPVGPHAKRKSQDLQAVVYRIAEA